MRFPALMLVVLSQFFAAEPLAAQPLPAQPLTAQLSAPQPLAAQASPHVDHLKELSRLSAVTRRVRRLRSRRLGLLIGSAVPLLTGVGLSVAGGMIARDDRDPFVLNFLGGIGIAAGIFMLGRGGRVGYHARRLERGPSLVSMQHKYLRRFRRLAGIGGAFILLGGGTLIASLALLDGCDDDDWCIIPPRAAGAVPAAIVTAAGLAMLAGGLGNRARSRRVRVHVGIGPMSAKLRLEF